MKRKRVYIFMFFVAVTVRGFGQQDPQFTQHMYTILPINPGFAGSTGICASLHYRNQWMGFVDTDTTGKTYKTSPEDIMFTVHSNVKKLHGALGLTVYNDKYGHQSDVTVKLGYAFKTNIAGGVLGVGPSFDFMSRQIKTDEFWAGQSADPLIWQNMGKTDMYFDVSLGAFYDMQGKWYAGLSATQLLSMIGGKTVNQKASQHIYAVGGYEFEIPSNPNWTLKPCGLLKTDLKSVQIDATLIADWSQMFWVGVSYRAIDAVAILGGTRPFINYTTPIRGLEAAISYDINTSKLMNYGRSFGGLEVSIKYCFKIVTKPTVSGYKGTRLLGNRPIEYR